MSNHLADAGIPLLTEVIPSPPSSEAKPASPTAAALPSTEDIAAHETCAAAERDDEQWDRLEREIRERVLYQVLERIDFVLEQRVRDSLADVLQTAVEGLASEIKSGLHHAIRDVVARAVTHEITELQTTKE